MFAPVAVVSLACRVGACSSPPSTKAATSEKLLAVSGYEAMAKEEGVPLVGLDEGQDPPVQRRVPIHQGNAGDGDDPISVDVVGAELLGLYKSDRLALGLRGHKTSPLIEAAAKRFGVDLGHVRAVGDGADLLSTPRPVHFKAIAPFGIDFEPPPSPSPPALLP